jgi:hypothetical protein
MKSKKWQRRRPVTLVLIAETGGWHKKVKFRREEWIKIEQAAAFSHETIEQFIKRAILEAANEIMGL